MHRFLVDIPLDTDQINLDNRALVHQLERVLHLEPGEQIRLFDGKGREVEVVISGYHGATCEVRKTKELASSADSKVRAVLYQAIIKHDNFEWVVEKATEIGVSEIVPVISERTIKKTINTARLEKIIKEASEQCGRQLLPTLREPVDVEQALREASGQKILCDASGSARPSLIQQGTVSIFVGPEGGFTPAEVELGKKHNCTIISLGDTILRAETAAIVASYTVRHTD